MPVKKAKAEKEKEEYFEVGAFRTNRECEKRIFHAFLRFFPEKVCTGQSTVEEKEEYPMGEFQMSIAPLRY